MKLLMAVSRDGFLATGPNDDMRWTGKMDKAIFKLLTLANDYPIFAGWKTAQMMPPLHNRVVHPLSHAGMTLESAAENYPSGWLIGGPTIALEALKLGLITQAILCRGPTILRDGISFHEIASHLSALPAHTIHIGEIEVMLFAPHAGGQP